MIDVFLITRADENPFLYFFRIRIKLRKKSVSKKYIFLNFFNPKSFYRNVNFETNSFVYKKVDVNGKKNRFRTIRFFFKKYGNNHFRQ